MRLCEQQLKIFQGKINRKKDSQHDSDARRGEETTGASNKESPLDPKGDDDDARSDSSDDPLHIDVQEEMCMKFHFLRINNALSFS